MPRQTHRVLRKYLAALTVKEIVRLCRKYKREFGDAIRTQYGIWGAHKAKIPSPPICYHCLYHYVLYKRFKSIALLVEDRIEFDNREPPLYLDQFSAIVKFKQSLSLGKYPDLPYHNNG